jgi:hypothetical protein
MTNRHFNEHYRRIISRFHHSNIFFYGEDSFERDEAINGGIKESE